MSTDTSHKRKIYEQIYSELTSIQRSYMSIAQQLSRHIEDIPSTPEEVKAIDYTESQITLANENIARIEEVKYVCSLAFLSDGALITSLEISAAINALDLFLDTAKIEKGAIDKTIASWAATKEINFKETRKILIDLLSYKMKRQVQFNRMEIQ